MMASGVKIQNRRGVSQDNTSTKSSSEDSDTDMTSSIGPTQDISHQYVAMPLDKLPRFSEILSRPETQGVDIDDLDLLQWDLEALLSATVVQIRVLEKDFSALPISEEETSPSTVTQTDTQSNTMSKMTEILNKQDEADDPLGSYKENKETTSKDVQSDFSKLNPIPHFSQRRYEPPNKFWTSMNPFCTDISYQDIKFLEELTEKYENNQDILKIPLLGRHYTECWAEEEMISQQCESHSEGKAKAKRSVTPMECDELVKKAQNLIKGPTTIPYTERIISALAGENIEVPENDRKVPDQILGVNKSHKSFVVNGGYGASSLERRIMAAFEDEANLNSDHQHSESVDEILHEIRNCQTEVEVINKYNATNLKRLLKLAKEDVVRQDLKRKIELVDNEIFENYQTLLSAKQRKVPLSRSLQERCWASMKERDELKSQFNSLFGTD